MSKPESRSDSEAREVPAIASWSFGAVSTLSAVVLGNWFGPGIAQGLVHYDFPDEVPLIFAMLTLYGSPVLVGLGVLAARVYRTNLHPRSLLERGVGLLVAAVMIACVHYGAGIVLTNF